MKVAHSDESKAGAAGKGAAILKPVSAAVLTMSSREIAELTGKEHEHVIRDICVMLFEPDNGPNLDQVRKEQDARGYTASIHLPKLLTLTLMAGYSVQMLHRIVVRWEELEAQQHAAAQGLPRTLADALRLVAIQAKELKAQQQQLEQQRRAVDFVDRYVASTGLMSVRAVAKLLKATEWDFVAWLVQQRVMYYLTGRLTPKACFEDAGLVETKLSSEENNRRVYIAPGFTPKGVYWVANEWAKHKASNSKGQY